MASGRISIPVGLETRGVAKGAKDAEKALGDLEDATKDTGTGGARNLDKIEDELKDVQKQSKKTGTDVETHVGKGFDEAGHSVEEFKDEANSTAKETAASFDGSAESIVGAFQEVAANAFAGFGPAGAVAGLAAAAGIGLLTSAFQEAEDHRKELEERANDLASAYVDAGSTVLGALEIASRTADILTDPEQKKRAQDLATALGVDLATGVRVLAGDTNALATTNGIVAGTTDEYQGLMRKLGSDYKSITRAEKQRFDQLEKQRDVMAEVNGITKTASETFNTQQDVLKGLIRSAEGATKQVDKLGNILYTLPDGEQILIEADTKQATTDVKNFKGDVDKIPKKHETQVQLNADLAALDRQIRNWKPPRIRIDADGVIHLPGGRTAV